jgi:hypothetical protein
MNWMIDGVHGDLYRTAMGYRPLTPHAQDEWEIERRTAAAPGFFKRALAGIQNIWGRARASLQTAGTYAPAKERTIS